MGMNNHVPIPGSGATGGGGPVTPGGPISGADVTVDVPPVAPSTEPGKSNAQVQLDAIRTVAYDIVGMRGQLTPGTLIGAVPFVYVPAVDEGSPPSLYQWSFSVNGGDHDLSGFASELDSLASVIAKINSSSLAGQVWASDETGSLKLTTASIGPGSYVRITGFSIQSNAAEPPVILGLGPNDEGTVYGSGGLFDALQHDVNLLKDDTRNRLTILDLPAAPARWQANAPFNLQMVNEPVEGEQFYCNIVVNLHGKPFTRDGVDLSGFADIDTFAATIAEIVGEDNVEYSTENGILKFETVRVGVTASFSIDSVVVLTTGSSIVPVLTGWQSYQAFGYGGTVPSLASQVVEFDEKIGNLESQGVVGTSASITMTEPYSVENIGPPGSELQIQMNVDGSNFAKSFPLRSVSNEIMLRNALQAMTFGALIVTISDTGVLTFSSARTGGLSSVSLDYAGTFGDGAEVQGLVVDNSKSVAPKPNGTLVELDQEPLSRIRILEASNQVAEAVKFAQQEFNNKLTGYDSEGNFTRPQAVVRSKQYSLSDLGRASFADVTWGDIGLGYDGMQVDYQVTDMLTGDTGSNVTYVNMASPLIDLQSAFQNGGPPREALTVYFNLDQYGDLFTVDFYPTEMDVITSLNGLVLLGIQAGYPFDGQLSPYGETLPVLVMNRVLRSRLRRSEERLNAYGQRLNNLDALGT